MINKYKTTMITPAEREILLKQLQTEKRPRKIRKILRELKAKRGSYETR